MSVFYSHDAIQSLVHIGKACGGNDGGGEESYDGDDAGEEWYGDHGGGDESHDGDDAGEEWYGGDEAGDE